MIGNIQKGENNKRSTPPDDKPGKKEVAFAEVWGEL